MLEIINTENLKLNSVFYHSMQIHLNGKLIELKLNKTIAELIKELGIKSEGIAVALNFEVVSKNNFDKTFVKDGDKIEIIHAVQGG